MWRCVRVNAFSVLLFAAVTQEFSHLLDYLYSLRAFGMKPGLERMQALLEALGRPDRSTRFLHIAGTNGKGSTAAMIAAITGAAGLRTGLFTSPHLTDFRERIRINGQPVGEDDACTVLAAVRTAADALADANQSPITFFEIVTAAAALYFCKMHCDVVVWETGLGGRFDATNAVDNVAASAITSISYDHMQWLGETIEQIAGEKAGIIRAKTPVFTSVSAGPALKVIMARARACQAPVSVVTEQEAAWDTYNGIERIEYQYMQRGAGCYDISIPRLELTKCQIGLRGRFQTANAALASTVAHWFLNMQSLPTVQYIREGLMTTNWPGRMQVLRATPLVVLDCAHNEDAIVRLVAALQELAPGPWRVVFGALADKSVLTMLRALLERSAEFWYLAPNNARALSAHEIMTLMSSVDKDRYVKMMPNALECVRRLQALAVGDMPTVVCGSCYLAGDVLAAWLGSERDARSDDPVRV